MKKLKDHNYRIQASGVECDKCPTEMVYDEGINHYASNHRPWVVPVVCPDCGYKGEKRLTFSDN